MSHRGDKNLWIQWQMDCVDFFYSGSESSLGLIRCPHTSVTQLSPWHSISSWCGNSDTAVITGGRRPSDAGRLVSVDLLICSAVHGSMLPDFQLPGFNYKPAQEDALRMRKQEREDGITTSCDREWYVSTDGPCSSTCWRAVLWGDRLDWTTNEEKTRCRTVKTNKRLEVVCRITVVLNTVETRE